MSDTCLDTTVSNDFLNYLRSKIDESQTALDLCRLIGVLYTEHLYGSLSEERIKYIFETVFGAHDEPDFDDDLTPDEQADRIALNLYEGCDDIVIENEEDDEEDDDDDDDEEYDDEEYDEG